MSTETVTLELSFPVLTKPAEVRSDAELSAEGGRSLLDFASFMGREPLESGAAQLLGQAWEEFQKANPEEWQAYARHLVELDKNIESASTPYAIAELRDLLAPDVHCPVSPTDPTHDLQSVLDRVIAGAMPVIAKLSGDDRNYVVTLADVRDFLEERRFFSELTGLQQEVWLTGTRADGKPLCIEAWSKALAKGFLEDWSVLGREDLSLAESRWALTQTVWQDCTEAQRTSLLDLLRDASGSEGSLLRGVLGLHGELIIGGTKSLLDQDLKVFDAESARVLSALMSSQRAMQDLQTWGAG